jgi:hypothetical protein
MSDHKYQLTALILQVEESAKELKVSAKVAMYGAAIVAKEKVSTGNLEVAILPYLYRQACIYQPHCTWCQW